MRSGLARYVPIIAAGSRRYRRSFLGARSARGARGLGRARAAGRCVCGSRGSASRGRARDGARGRRALRVFGTCRELDVGPSSTIAITAAAVLVPARRLVPGKVVRLAARRARDPHRCRCCRGRRPAPRLRRRVPRPTGARRLHQRDRRRDHRRADPEAARHLGRERQRARDALARDRRARRRSAGRRTLVGACLACSCSSWSVGSRRSFRGRSIVTVVAIVCQPGLRPRRPTASP